MRRRSRSGGRRAKSEKPRHVSKRVSSGTRLRIDDFVPHCAQLFKDYNQAVKRSRSALMLGIVLALSVIGICCALKRKAREKRDAAYQASLAAYSRDLRPGMTRKDVRSYLSARNTSFQPTGWQHRIDDLVQVGEDDDAASWPFTHEWVYIDFEYPWKPQSDLERRQLVFADSDVLEKIELVRIIDSP